MKEHFQTDVEASLVLIPKLHKYTGRKEIYRQKFLRNTDA